MSAKHKGNGLQSMTANHLKNGLSLWMTAEFDWSNNYVDALLTDDPDLIGKMQNIANRDEDANIVVAPYFIDIETDTRLPKRYREKFRVVGPTEDTGQKT